MPNPQPYEILSFGIDAVTGRPLPDPSAEAVANIARGFVPEPTKEKPLKKGADFSAVVLATPDQDDLAAMGWAVLFAEDDPQADEIAAALKPLLDRRAAQAGNRFKVLKGKDGYQTGQDAVTWLGKRNLSVDLVDPDMGLPFYVLLIGAPSLIPMDFQYRLDIFWAVGRLDFEQPGDYARYAQSVIDHEDAATAGNGRFGLFAPRHDFDAATQLFHRAVVTGLQSATLPPGFTLRPLLAAEATKEGYARLISGDEGAGTPQLIFTGGHGMEFPRGDPRQIATQGALVCQDWPGYGAIDSDDWFAASDVPDAAQLAGTIHFVFACYGGGCSKIDTFRDERGTALQISDADRSAALPRALMLHKDGGALAVIAHVDRAFACSFALNSGAPQTQGFRDVLWSLMRGYRAGNALDRFNARWGATATVLADALSARKQPPADDDQLYQLWISRDDARNYVLLGDPAVRLKRTT